MKELTDEKITKDLIRGYLMGIPIFIVFMIVAGSLIFLIKLDIIMLIIVVLIFFIIPVLAILASLKNMKELKQGKYFILQKDVINVIRKQRASMLFYTYVLFDNGLSMYLPKSQSSKGNANVSDEEKEYIGKPFYLVLLEKDIKIATSPHIGYSREEYKYVGSRLII